MKKRKSPIQAQVKNTAGTRGGLLDPELVDAEAADPDVDPLVADFVELRVLHGTERVHNRANRVPPAVPVCSRTCVRSRARVK